MLARHIRNPELDVQLEVAGKLLARDDVAFAWYDLHDMVRQQFPLGFFALKRLPRIKIVAIEEDDGTARGRHDCYADLVFWLRGRDLLVCVIGPNARATDQTRHTHQHNSPSA